jgi:hypothetical protein
MRYIPRNLTDLILRAKRRFPAVVVTGPRPIHKRSRSVDWEFIGKRRPNVVRLSGFSTRRVHWSFAKNQCFP